MAAEKSVAKLICYTVVHAFFSPLILAQRALAATEIFALAAALIVNFIFANGTGTLAASFTGTLLLILARRAFGVAFLDGGKLVARKTGPDAVLACF